MKIIEGLKKIKDLVKKAEDIRGKIAAHCADMDHESPTYGTAEQQSQQIIEGLKKIKDLVKKAEDIRGKIAAHCADNEAERQGYIEKFKIRLEAIRAVLNKRKIK